MSARQKESAGSLFSLNHVSFNRLAFVKHFAMCTSVKAATETKFYLLTLCSGEIIIIIY